MATGPQRKVAPVRGRGHLAESIEQVTDPRLRRVLAQLAQGERDAPEFETDRLRRRRVRVSGVLQRDGRGLSLNFDDSVFQEVDGQLRVKPQGDWASPLDSSGGDVTGELQPAVDAVGATPTGTEFNALAAVVNDNVAQLQWQIDQMKKLLVAAGLVG